MIMKSLALIKVFGIEKNVEEIYYSIKFKYVTIEEEKYD